MGKKKKSDVVNEPPAYYGQGLTFEKVWQMFQETNLQFKETDKKFQETDRKIENLCKTVSGIGHNNGDVAEEFFRRGLQARSEIMGIPYRHVDKLFRATKKLTGEYDIVLFNGDFLVVIEVKYKLHPSDVQDFHDRKIPNFRLLYPEYASKKLIAGVAGMSVPPDSEELAKKLGMLVLVQSGENIAVLNNPDFQITYY